MSAIFAFLQPCLHIFLPFKRIEWPFGDFSYLFLHLCMHPILSQGLFCIKISQEFFDSVTFYCCRFSSWKLSLHVKSQQTFLVEVTKTILSTSAYLHLLSLNHLPPSAFMKALIIFLFFFFFLSNSVVEPLLVPLDVSCQFELWCRLAFLAPSWVLYYFYISILPFFPVYTLFVLEVIFLSNRTEHSPALLFLETCQLPWTVLSLKFYSTESYIVVSW